MGQTGPSKTEGNQYQVGQIKTTKPQIWEAVTKRKSEWNHLIVRILDSWQVTIVQ